MRKVQEVMEPTVFFLTEDAPLSRAAEELTARDISGAPVCDPRGRIVGVLSKTNLVESFGRAAEDRVVADVMTPMAFSVRPEDPLERAISLMAFEGVHRLLVVGSSGSLEGILTSMDVLREMAGYGRTEPRVIAVAPPPSEKTSKR